MVYAKFHIVGGRKFKNQFGAGLENLRNLFRARFRKVGHLFGAGPENIRHLFGARFRKLRQ